jgi:hypothetical protein
MQPEIKTEYFSNKFGSGQNIPENVSKHQECQSEKERDHSLLNTKELHLK